MKPLRFTATLLADKRGSGTYIEIDDAMREALGGGGRIPVRATFNEVEYRGTVCRMGGVFCLGVNREIRGAARAEAGGRVRVTLARDVAVRSVDVPADLAGALAKNPIARDLFDLLSFTHRKEYVRWIESAKKAQTRQDRIAKAVVMLRSGTKTPDSPKIKDRSVAKSSRAGTVRAAAS